MTRTSRERTFRGTDTGGPRPPALEAAVRQESALVALNAAVLILVVLLQAAFSGLIGRPSYALGLTIALRLAALGCEWRWLQTRREASDVAAVRVYAAAAVFLNIGFAFFASVVDRRLDSHYSVLMVAPLVAAASRFTLAGTMAAAALASGFTYLQVWLYFKLHPPADTGEFFEAASVSLIFFVVGSVVWLLVSRLRHDSVRLAHSIAELELAHGRLVATEKLAAVGRLSSAIAHEIRNPVAMISSSLSTAAGERVDADVRSDMLAVAAQEAGRLERLTTDFLAYARTREPNRRPVSLETTLGYVAGVAAARAADAGVEIAVECPEDARLDVDQFQVHQALLNLVMNALDATPRGGTVAVGGAPDGAAVRLWVENPGEPIPADETDRIFEPFFTTKPQGTGLGLGIARNIALAHGGDLRLAANEAGRVRFEIDLPAAPREEVSNG